MGARLRVLVLIMTACVVVLGLARSAHAERRVALVIGNAKYQHVGELANPLSDAKAVSDMLKRVGFDAVNLRQDVGVVDFKRAVREFMDKSAQADIAVVYYSGHGIEFGGVNYLIPVDAQLSGAVDVDDEAVSLDRLLTATGHARKLSLIILDACRENPFLRAEGNRVSMRALSQGLGGVAAVSANTLVAYAAKAGSVSFDGMGANSPFTTAFVKYLALPDLDIRIALGMVRDEVMAETNGRQEPFVYGSLGGANVSLVPAKSVSDTSVLSGSSGGSAEPMDYQLAERVGSLDAWKAFVAAHPKGFYAQLAQAQIDKLGGKESPPVPQVATIDVKRSQPIVASLPAQANAPEPSAAMDTCGRDKELLAHLRAAPTPAEADRLSKELKCEILRPQLARLLESLGITPTPGAPLSISSPTPLAGGGAKSDSPQTCDLEAAELARLRANPNRKAAEAFQAGMSCAALKPQALRLLESLAD